MKALVIDDSTAARFILSKMLTELGFEVTQANDGKQAMDKLVPGEKFDLALVDWNMPVMNGLEFVQSVRSSATSAEQVSKIMMVTTETEMTQVVRAIEAGADEYVMKPFTKAVIEDKLQILGLVSPPA